MRHERLLTDKVSSRDTPPTAEVQAPALPTQIALCLALVATLALWTLVRTPAGLHQLLLLCCLRLTVLACVAAVSYRSLRRRRAAPDTPPGSSCSGSSVAHSPRATLAQVAFYLQLLWLAAELVLGSALLIHYPGAAATDDISEVPLASGTLLTLLPLCCTAVMSGCFLFLQRLSRRRRQRCAAPCAAMTLECGLGARTLHHHMHPQQQHPCYASDSCSSQVDIICSPLSDAGSFSSAASSASCCAYQYQQYGVHASCVGGSGGAPSPTSHVRSASESAEAQHSAAIQAACEIILMEHQLDNHEYVMFVHKKLRPIKTRPEDRSRPPAPNLLRDLITNSFTFQNDPELAAQLAASMRAAAGAAGDGSATSGACSITFQSTVAAAEVM